MEFSAGTQCILSTLRHRRADVVPPLLEYLLLSLPLYRNRLAGKCLMPGGTGFCVTGVTPRTYITENGEIVVYTHERIEVPSAGHLVIPSLQSSKPGENVLTCLLRADMSTVLSFLLSSCNFCFLILYRFSFVSATL